MTQDIERDWVEEVGAPAWASIAALVAALECDYDRLEELRDERRDLVDAAQEDEDDTEGAQEALEAWEADNHEELDELTTAAGDCDSQDTARQRIGEDALSVRVFGERVDGEWTADNYEILLTTGGPAVRIVGDLDGNGEPSRARLEVQDWGKPWTEYFKADADTLLTYARCFFFGE